jgi:hypothetical protein
MDPTSIRCLECGGLVIQPSRARYRLATAGSPPPAPPRNAPCDCARPALLMPRSTPPARRESRGADAGFAIS